MIHRLFVKPIRSTWVSRAVQHARRTHTPRDLINNEGRNATEVSENFVNILSGNAT